MAMALAMALALAMAMTMTMAMAMTIAKAKAKAKAKDKTMTQRPRGRHYDLRHMPGEAMTKERCDYRVGSFRCSSLCDHDGPHLSWRARLDAGATVDDLIEQDGLRAEPSLHHLIKSGVDLGGVPLDDIAEAGIKIDVGLLELARNGIDLTDWEAISAYVDLSYGAVNVRDLIDMGVDLSQTTWAELHDSGVEIGDASWDDIVDARIPGPVVPDIHGAVACAIGDLGQYLHMENWHGACGTVHCRAGWVVTLAGEEGAELEAIADTPTAAAIIYHASDPDMTKAPRWYASHSCALGDIRDHALGRCGEPGR